jgi:hypothetical protein
MYYFLGAEYFASEAHSSVPCLRLWSQIETMSPNKRIVVGDRVTITGGSHVCRVGTVRKVLPRSYHIQFDVMEKPREKSPSCIWFWNVKLVPDPPCAPRGGRLCLRMSRAFRPHARKNESKRCLPTLLHRWCCLCSRQCRSLPRRSGPS